MTDTTDLSPTDILKRASDDLVINGWTTGQLGEVNGPHCVLGAISMAAGIRREDSNRLPYPAHYVEPARLPLIARVLRAMWKAIPGNEDRPVPEATDELQQDIYHYNDREAGDRDNVLSLLNRAMSFVKRV